MDNIFTAELYSEGAPSARVERLNLEVRARLVELARNDAGRALWNAGVPAIFKAAHITASDPRDYGNWADSINDIWAEYAPDVED